MFLFFSKSVKLLRRIVAPSELDFEDADQAITKVSKQELYLQLRTQARALVGQMVEIFWHNSFPPPCRSFMITHTGLLPIHWRNLPVSSRLLFTTVSAVFLLFSLGSTPFSSFSNYSPFPSVDHQGVTNTQLVKENTQLAGHYKNKSVAEQNSVDLCWSLLMDDAFADLRACIYTDVTEYRRFRQLVVNSVMVSVHSHWHSIFNHLPILTR